MKMTSQFVCAATLSLLLSGCAMKAAPLPQDVTSKLKRVAVISRVANVFTRQYVGTIAFDNEKEERDISSWNIDRIYEAQLSSIVENNLGVQIIKAPYSESAFSHVNDLNGPWNAKAFWGPNWGAIESTTKKYCESNMLDAVLVVAKNKVGDFLGGTNQSIGGLGFYVRGTGTKASVMHLVAKVALLDCITGKPIAERPLAVDHDGLPGAILRAAPISNADNDTARTPLSKWNDELEKKIRADMIVLPNEAWQETIKSIFLGGK